MGFYWKYGPLTNLKSNVRRPIIHRPSRGEKRLSVVVVANVAKFKIILKDIFFFYFIGKLRAMRKYNLHNFRNGIRSF